MIFQRGDVVVVYFPHSDLRTVKLRPVLLVQADGLNTGIAQVVVAMINSNLARANHPSRVKVLLNDAISAGSGLRLDSVIMTDNMATIQTDQFRGRLGTFLAMHLVDAALRHTLNL